MLSPPGAPIPAGFVAAAALGLPICLRASSSLGRKSGRLWKVSLICPPASGPAHRPCCSWRHSESWPFFSASSPRLALVGIPWSPQVSAAPLGARSSCPPGLAWGVPGGALEPAPCHSASVCWEKACGSWACVPSHEDLALTLPCSPVLPRPPSCERSCPEGRRAQLCTPPAQQVPRCMRERTRPSRSSEMRALLWPTALCSSPRQSNTDDPKLRLCLSWANWSGSRLGGGLLAGPPRRALCLCRRVLVTCRAHRLDKQSGPPVRHISDLG